MQDNSCNKKDNTNNNGKWAFNELQRTLIFLEHTKTLLIKNDYNYN